MLHLSRWKHGKGPQPSCMTQPVPCMPHPLALLLRSCTGRVQRQHIGKSMARCTRRGLQLSDPCRARKVPQSQHSHSTVTAQSQHSHSCPTLIVTFRAELSSRQADSGCVPTPSIRVFDSPKQTNIPLPPLILLARARFGPPTANPGRWGRQSGSASPSTSRCGCPGWWRRRWRSTGRRRPRSPSSRSPT